MWGRRARRESARLDACREAALLGPGLVHELRQPLMGIDAGLRLLARDAGAAVTALEAWELVQSQVSRIRETLQSYEELMDGSRLEARPFEVEPIVRRAADLVRFRTKRLGERFALTIEPGLPVAHGTPGALLHAITNLVVNADDAIAEAGGLGRLEVRAVPGASGRPEIRVADEGVGIAAGTEARIFDAGFTTKSEHDGTGLGLTIARRMLRACGCELHLSAAGDPLRRPWAKTEFVIELARAGAEPVPLSTRPRRVPRRALAVAACAAAVALGAALFAVRGRGSVAAPPLDGAAPAAPDASVVEVTGSLERRLASGGWAVVPSGSPLRADDTIRTGASGRALLAIGTSARLTVAPTTQLTVRELTVAAQRLRLTRGLVAVDQAADGARMLLVESASGEAVAKASAARFTVLSTPSALAVATEKGAVRLASGGAVVDVPAGRQSVAVRGAPPRPVTPVPVGLLLKVANAAQPGATLCAIVEGTVAPGSELTIDGEPVVPGVEGRFLHRVRRRPGANEAVLVTRDPSGRIAERRIPCAARTEHDISDLTVRWQHANLAP